MTRKRGFLFISIVIMFVALIGLCACDDDKPTDVNATTGVVSGTVYTPTKSGLSGVTVSIGTKTTVTDANGEFALSGITPGDEVKVDFAKAGYVSNQKVVKVLKGKTVYTSSTMFVPATTTFSAVTGANIADGITVIEIPGNSFVDAQGNPFIGNVISEMKYFDPTLPECLDAFPGDFVGEQTDGTQTMIESYGFLSANFFDAANPTQKLSLSEDASAHFYAPIPTALLASAPGTIPLWYYDEVAGIWKEEGFATKIGNYYDAVVQHFTYWNFDHPIIVDDQATLSGTVLFDNGDPVIGAQVVATGQSYSGYTRGYSDAEGHFSVIVKANAIARVQAFGGQNVSNMTEAINTPAGGGTLDIGTLTVTDMTFTVRGRVLDASGNPLSGAWGQMFQLNPPANSLPFNEWLNLDADGRFNFTSMNAGSQNSYELIVKIEQRSTLFSNHFTFNVPSPGQVRDLGDITVRPGGILAGRLKDNAGNWLSEKWITFTKVGASGEGSGFYSGMTDTNGNFTIQGPPNTTLTTMRGSVYIDGTNYYSPTMSLRFPASGATGQLGTIVVTPDN